MRPDITEHELIKHLANKDSQTDDVVQLLNLMQEPMTPKELSEQHPVEEKAVYEVTDFLEPWAVERSQHGARQLTTAGEIARRSYSEANKTIDSDDLTWLSWSKNRGRILNRLRTDGPATAKELSNSNNLPGIRTIRRNFDEFADRDWVDCEEKTDRRILGQLTINGGRISRAYDDLLAKMEQVIDKAPCLRDLGLECADIPVKHLADAEIVEATPEHPFRIEKRVRRLSDADFQHFRGFQSHWNPETSKAYQPAIDAGKQFEVISPPLGLDDFPSDPQEVSYVINGLRAKNCQWFMYPDTLPCSFAILDANRMVVGPRDPGSSNKVRTGAIISQNDELVDWALNMYEAYHRQTRDPFDLSVGFGISIEDLINLLRDRYLSEDEENSSDE